MDNNLFSDVFIPVSMLFVCSFNVLVSLQAKSFDISESWEGEIEVNVVSFISFYKPVNSCKLLPQLSPTLKKNMIILKKIILSCHFVLY